MGGVVEGRRRGEGVAKGIARAGIASRREVERMIGEGRVAVDGSVLDSPAVLVTEASRITVDGKPLTAAERARLWRYRKPRGLMSTHRDPEGRPTLFDSLPSALPRVISVGRLDFNSEGLLLLTNDGALARHLELPATGWRRRYRARVHGRVDPAALDRLKAGVTVDGITYGPIDAALERHQGSNPWLAIGLARGKNPAIRKS